MPSRAVQTTQPSLPRRGLARVLSKRGVCSRSEAARWIAQGRVTVDGRIVRDPEFPVAGERPRIAVDGRIIDTAERVYLMLNKPRGLVTSASDERQRDTIYRCLEGAGLPWVAPVGRLDKASEGLLLLCNDPEWAARITDPATGPEKTYHVQVDAVPDAALFASLEQGVDCDGERLRARSATLLRAGTRNAWLEIVLDEGKNRQVRRMLEGLGVEVLRLVRVAIGGLALGHPGSGPEHALPKGHWRRLSDEEVAMLASPGKP
ncbi:MAG TPA: pseudouridine synthase [Xanthomonadaceae bacterium]|nr:pseudouridine synthase [Xanthomonadaceae bacterium]